MKILKNILGLITAFCLILILLISSVDLIIYGMPGFFEKEYTKYQVAEQVQMETGDLLYVTDEMLKYLKGKRADLHITSTIGNEPEEFFNEREIYHMEDVRALFLTGMKVRTLCIVLAAVSILLLISIKSKVLDILSRMVLWASGIFTGLLLAAGLFISMDFTKAFILFHEILFTNDLWLLDPATDRLINIVPEPFFMDTARYIGITFGLSMLFLIIICACFRKKHKCLA